MVEDEVVGARDCLFFLIGVVVLLVFALAFIPNVVGMVQSVQSGVAELRTLLEDASLPR